MTDRSPVPLVLLDRRPLDEFVAAATPVYDSLTSDQPRPCFAALLGDVRDDAVHVRKLAFGANARLSDPAAREEFRRVIVPRYGAAYENPHRAWWMDSRDVLRTALAAEAEGLDIVGSIHMHPDWHRIGPPQARGVPLSAAPTPMDEHVFAGTAWPVNIICYLERLAGSLYYTVQAWRPPPGGGQPCAPLALRIGAAEPARVPVHA